MIVKGLDFYLNPFVMPCVQLSWTMLAGESPV